mmetsp:Transcript_12327/g.21365  ORF Transcript_12327/g.21365 Transcript_12327/m.21365 type:complete len:209 (+) Transcript_12327:130-756(+)
MKAALLFPSLPISSLFPFCPHPHALPHSLVLPSASSLAAIFKPHDLVFHSNQSCRLHSLPRHSWCHLPISSCTVPLFPVSPSFTSLPPSLGCSKSSPRPCAALVLLCRPLLCVSSSGLPLFLFVSFHQCHPSSSQPCFCLVAHVERYSRKAKQGSSRCLAVKHKLHSAAALLLNTRCIGHQLFYNVEQELPLPCLLCIQTRAAVQRHC